MSVSASEYNSDIDNEDSLSSVSSLEDEEKFEYIGQVLEHRYLILDYLNNGTFCRVYMAYDIQVDKYCAIKVLNYDSTNEGQIECSFLYRTNNCKNIVKIYDSFLRDNSFFLVLELMGVAVIDLINRVDIDNKVHSVVVKKIVHDALNGIKELNHHSLIHTDLKLENLMTNFFPERTKKVIEIVNSLDIQEARRVFYNGKISCINSSWSRDELALFKSSLREDFNKMAKKLVSIELKRHNLPEHNSVGDISSITSDNLICKIIDLGNAEEYDVLFGYNKGTIHIRCYRPPENFKYNNFYVKSDIWTMGCLLYEMLFYDKLFDLEYSNKKEEYLDYIRETVSNLEEIIRPELEEINFRTNAEREYYFELLKNTLVINYDKRWSVNDCLNSGLFKD